MCVWSLLRKVLLRDEHGNQTRAQAFEVIVDPHEPSARSSAPTAPPRSRSSYAWTYRSIVVESFECRDPRGHL
jgi:hypothetical protein